jgi:hypothetical protein
MPKKGLTVRLTRSNGFPLAEIVELEASISMALGLTKIASQSPTLCCAKYSELYLHGLYLHGNFFRKANPEKEGETKDDPV